MRLSVKHITAVVAVAICALAPSPAKACFMRSPMPVQVWLDHIHVNITDRPTAEWTGSTPIERFR